MIIYDAYLTYWLGWSVSSRLATTTTIDFQSHFIAPPRKSCRNIQIDIFINHINPWLTFSKAKPRTRRAGMVEAEADASQFNS